jgi:hypothetical protein
MIKYILISVALIIVLLIINNTKKLKSKEKKEYNNKISTKQLIDIEDNEFDLKKEINNYQKYNENKFSSNKEH